MVTIVIIALVTLTFGINFIIGERQHRSDWNIDSWIGHSFTVLVISAMITFLGSLLIGSGIGYLTGAAPADVSYDFNIIAAADGSELSGSHFLFGGSIDETPMYFFYRQRSDGAITQGHIPVSRSTIYEDTGGNGYIHVVDYNSVVDTWGLGMDSEEKRYEIHVPPGSVRQQFNFDLE